MVTSGSWKILDSLSHLLTAGRLCQGPHPGDEVQKSQVTQAGVGRLQLCQDVQSYRFPGGGVIDEVVVVFVGVVMVVVMLLLMLVVLIGMGVMVVMAWMVMITVIVL